jgi:predicted CXXCH cytochrome family protein
MAVENAESPVPHRFVPRPTGTARRAAAVALALVFLTLAVSIGLSVFRQRRPPEDGGQASSSDPRLSYAGPFRNLSPNARYVPDDRCAECHAVLARSYAEHPMGRSLVPVAAATRHPEDQAHHNSFNALGSRFALAHEDGKTRHRRTRLDPAGQPAAFLEWEVHYAIGSGLRGQSFLTMRDDYPFQTPISWYAQKDAWDLSPGFGPNYLTGRPVVPECLFCHSNGVEFREGSLNHIAPGGFAGHAIGCQRCHGPGELHADSRGRSEPISDGVDYTIVNPRRLERALREAVCEQCHLEGEIRVVRAGRAMYDFRPGLPLDRFWSVFVHPAEDGVSRKVVSQVEQMYESRCFQAGQGSMGCISCHDPHERVQPAQRVEHYRRACLACHGEGVTCSLPEAQRRRQSALDSCIDCHMPRYGAADVPHTAFTDHRILRSAERGTASTARAAALRPARGMPVLSFYGARKQAPDGEDDRDLGMAVVKLALQGDAAAARAVGRAVPLLEAALRRNPDDVPAQELLGCALGLANRTTEALTAFEAVLARAPERELALMGAASASAALGRQSSEVDYLRRAIAANPWAPDYRRNLVLRLVREERWNEAEPEIETWVRLDPMSADARSARVLCLLAAGNQDAAEAEIKRIEALAPANLAELKALFQQRRR